MTQKLNHLTHETLEGWELREDAASRTYVFGFCTNGEQVFHTSACGSRGANVFAWVDVPAAHVVTRLQNFRLVPGIRDQFCGNCTITRIKHVDRLVREAMA